MSRHAEHRPLKSCEGSVSRDAGWVPGGPDGREFVGWVFGVRLLWHLEGGGCDQAGRDGEAISHSGRVVARAVVLLLDA